MFCPRATCAPPARLGLLPALAYGAGSLTLSLWAMGMLVAAGPGSDTMAAIYPVFEGPLSFLDINNDWGFFAPNPNTGSVLRYEVSEPDGTEHTFALTEALQGWMPAYFRYTTLYTAIGESHDTYAEGAARLLCRRHADLQPVDITFVVWHQVEIGHEAYLAGHGIMDGLVPERHLPVACPEPTSATASTP